MYCRNCRDASTNGCRAWPRKASWARTPSSPVSARRLEIFSRYSRVEKASGEAVSLKEYLEHVWAAVAKEALAMIFAGADATGFEEDARLTAMWLWTLSTAASNGNGASAAEDEELTKTRKTRATAAKGKRRWLRARIRRGAQDCPGTWRASRSSSRRWSR